MKAHYCRFSMQMSWPWSRPLLYVLYKFSIKRQTQPTQKEFQQVRTGVVSLIFMNVCQCTAVEDHSHNGCEEKEVKKNCLYKADLWNKPSSAELLCTIALNVLECGLTKLERPKNLTPELPSLGDSLGNEQCLQGESGLLFLVFIVGLLCLLQPCIN